jgi:hypothetical protein
MVAGFFIDDQSSESAAILVIRFVTVKLFERDSIVKKEGAWGVSMIATTEKNNSYVRGMNSAPGSAQVRLVNNSKKRKGVSNDEFA